MRPSAPPTPRLALALAAIALSLAACGRERPSSAAAGPAAPASAPPAAAGVPASAPDAGQLVRLPAPRRLVAIGDLHGDLAATRRALRLAGAIDERDRWTGGDLVVVQVGDQLDRGDDEQAILDLLERLGGEARAAGGALVVLNGNHEIMNALGDFRYVTPGGARDFDDAPGVSAADPAVAGAPAEIRARAAAFRPGGPYSRILAGRSLYAIVGDSAFVHGGILPAHVEAGLAELDHATRRWLAGTAPSPPRALLDEEAPIWTRRYGLDPVPPEACAELDVVLSRLGVRRLVVGHTVHREGVRPACDGKVWRIDVGMAAAYGGPTEVLEIIGDQVRPLRAR